MIVIAPIEKLVYAVADLAVSDVTLRRIYRRLQSVKKANLLVTGDFKLEQNKNWRHSLD